MVSLLLFCTMPPLDELLYTKNNNNNNFLCASLLTVSIMSEKASALPKCSFTSPPPSLHSSVPNSSKCTEAEFSQQAVRFYHFYPNLHSSQTAINANIGILLLLLFSSIERDLCDDEPVLLIFAKERIRGRQAILPDSRDHRNITNRQTIEKMSTSSGVAASPLVPDDASDTPKVLFKKQILKLGLDGSSLPRLVVVTENNLYICLPSGGITRTIAIARIERVTLCPREDVVNDEHGANENIENGEASAAAASASEKNGGEGGSDRDAAPPPAPNQAKKDRAKSPGSLFASMFSRGKSTEAKKSTNPHNRGYREDVDETHPVSPTSDAPPTQQRRGSSSVSSTGSTSSSGGAAADASPTPPSSAWAVIVTVGIAFEAPLALQLLRYDDGVDFVTALRASSNISVNAVFNTPYEDGPTNAAGQPLFTPPPRRADPIVPRVLERDGEVEGGVEARHGDAGKKRAKVGGTDEVAKAKPVGKEEEMVELSPSSPRSASVASTLPTPSHKERSGTRANGNEENTSVEREAASQLRGETHAQEVASPPSARPPHPTSSTPRSSPSSSKASRVHTTEPSIVNPPWEDGMQRDMSVPVVVLTPLQEPAPSAPGASTQLQSLSLQEQEQQPHEALSESRKSPTISSVTPWLATASEPEGRTPSPLRAAPQREAPRPPLQSLASSSPPPVAAVPSSAFPMTNAAPAPAAEEDTLRALRVEEEQQEERPQGAPEGKPPALAAKPRAEAKTPSTWETIRDGEAHSARPDLFSSAYAPASASLLSSAAATATTPAATSESRQRAASENQRFYAEKNEAVPPVHLGALQAELAEQSETVARLRHSLQAQETLLLELAEVKKEVRHLRTTLAERDAQCAEWQAAYTHAEEHVGRLRREQEHVLAAQEEKLRRAHREELEAVQAAFEEYDTRMTSFVEQLQRDHREAAAQWQHERRTLHHQLEEVLQQEEAAERSRAVTEAAAWEAQQQQQQQRQRQRQPSPHSSVMPADAASYLDQGAGYAPSSRTPPDGNADAHEHARDRVQEKLDAYVAQRQRRRQTVATPPLPASATSAPWTSPRPRHAAATSPWPQPRSAVTAPAPPQLSSSTASPRVAFGAHQLFDNLIDSKEEDSSSAGVRSIARSAGAPQSRRREPRGDSLIQTPPSSSLEGPSECERVRRDAGGYIPHRRSFV